MTRRSVRVTKVRPADWPAPDDIPGRYPTPFGVLVITDKYVTHIEKESSE